MLKIRDKRHEKSNDEKESSHGRTTHHQTTELFSLALFRWWFLWTWCSLFALVGHDHSWYILGKIDDEPSTTQRIVGRGWRQGVEDQHRQVRMFDPVTYWWSWRKRGELRIEGDTIWKPGLQISVWCMEPIQSGCWTDAPPIFSCWFEWQYLLNRYTCLLLVADCGES